MFEISWWAFLLCLSGAMMLGILVAAILHTGHDAEQESKSDLQWLQDEGEAMEGKDVSEIK